MGSRGRNSWGQAILFLHPTTETRGRPQSVDPINPCDPCRRKRGHLHSQELANLPAGAIEANNGVLSCATPWGYIGIDLNISAHKEINDPLSLSIYIYTYILTQQIRISKQELVPCCSPFRLLNFPSEALECLNLRNMPATRHRSRPSWTLIKPKHHNPTGSFLNERSPGFEGPDGLLRMIQVVDVNQSIVDTSGRLLGVKTVAQTVHDPPSCRAVE